MSRRGLGSRAELEELPAELTQARRFVKARSARSTAVLEDYVELIADLLATAGEARPTDIARRTRRLASDCHQHHCSSKTRGTGDGPSLSRGVSD